MNVYLTIKVGEREQTISIEVDENSPGANVGFEQMHKLINDFSVSKVKQDAKA
jgi:hypothetical protein